MNAKLNLKDDFISLGFKENGSGIHELKNANGKFICQFLQKDWTIENWLTIELIQGRNKFTKYNGLIETSDDLHRLYHLLIKNNENQIR